MNAPSENENSQGGGCGRTAEGKSKPGYAAISRDFHDPYLELIRLLKEASEIEHSLMIQYLFAAFTLKPEYEALVGPPVPSSDGLLGIAIQEMQHLAVVNRLLVALGGAPNLDRQDFPHEPDIYPFQLNLEPLSRASLARYTYVEAGRDSFPVGRPMNPAEQRLCDRLTAEVGTDTGLNHVAGLYAVIISQLEAMANRDEFLLDDYDQWLDKLKQIMIEGEQNHFEFFTQVFMGDHPVFKGKKDPWDLPRDHSGYPSFSVTSNPTAYLGHTNQIESSDARALAWLSNLHYWIVLMMLDLHYRIDNPALDAMAQAQMIGPLHALSIRLAEYGTGLPFDRLSVGYSPAPDHAGNLLFIRRLSNEADALAHDIQSNLPDTYPLGIHQATSALIDSQLDG